MMRTLGLRSILVASTVLAACLGACSSDPEGEDPADDAGASADAASDTGTTPRPDAGAGDAAADAPAPGDAAPDADPADAEADAPVDAGPPVCPANQYWNGAACTACSGACAAGEYQTTACSTTTDRVCGACTAVAQCAQGLTCTNATDSQCTSCNAGWVLVEGAGGAADTCARAKTCAEIARATPNAPDGVYTVDPDGAGALAPFDVTCDMTTNGGGWTLIGKVGNGSWPELTQQEYVNLFANPTNDVNANLLQVAGAPAAKEIAFYRMDKTNALYHATPYAGQSAVRVDFDSAENDATDGTYFQQRKVNDDTWNFWAAIRDARLWSSAASVAPWVSNYGTDFVLTRTAADFDAATNVVTHGPEGDVEFGFWDVATLTLADNSTLQVSRHGGLLNDGVANRGWQWMFTANPSDGRFKNESYPSTSTIWLR